MMAVTWFISWPDGSWLPLGWGVADEWMVREPIFQYEIHAS